MAQIWIARPVPGGLALPDVGSWEGIPIKGKHPRRENQLLKPRSSTQAIFSCLNHIGEMWSRVMEHFQEKSEMNGVNCWRAKTLALLCSKLNVCAKFLITHKTLKLFDLLGLFSLSENQLWKLQFAWLSATWVVTQPISWCWSDDDRK